MAQHSALFTHEKPGVPWARIGRGFLGGAIRRLFPSLSNRGYRILWQGNLGIFLAQWMQFTVEGWLIYDLTGSAFYLSLLTLCRSLPIMLVAPIGGVLADRFDRARIMMAAQSLAVIGAAGVGVLVVTEQLQAWHLLGAAVLGGVVTAVFVPARQAITSRLVPGEQLLNAFSVHATSLGAIRVLGPQIAGVLLATIGAAACYAIQTSAYVWGIANHVRLRLGKEDGRMTGHGFLRSLLDGLRYARNDSNVQAILVVMLVYTVLLYPYMQFLPAFAKDVLGIGAEGLGMMLAAGGAGALLGSLLAASLGSYRRKGLLLAGSCLLIGVLVIVLAASRSPWLSAFILLGAGAGGAMIQVLGLAAMQTVVPDNYRGRMGSLDMTVWGMMPLGALPIGLIAGVVGIPVAISIAAGLGAACALAAAIFMPALRRLEC